MNVRKRYRNIFQLDIHCVKIVQIRRFFWSLFSRIRTEYGEILIIIVRGRNQLVITPEAAIQWCS